MTSTTPMRRRRPLRPQWPAWVLLTPFLAAFVLVFAAPIVYAVVTSLFRTQLLTGTVFVGLDNYVRAVGDPKLWQGLTTVLLLLGVQVPIMLGVALGLALAIDSGRLHGMRFLRISVFLPYAVPAVVSTLIWGFMYSSRYGLIGSLNDALGLDLPDPLRADLILASIGNIVTWEFIGYNMLIFYSALRIIPRSLYEAAAIDGAGELRLIRSVKLPGIRGALLVTVVFSIIGSFQLFSEPSILQGLAPNAISSFFTPNLYAFTLSFSGQQISYASAVSILLGLVTAAIAFAVQARTLRRTDA
ncbi:multiple sugar transport system permease protein [Rathayibacter sp. PhB151]|uniref:carbohydrate ABC transporter permease n=1 Tax=Rathayibacter sp. PhB151 TaxID=2485189 RepID=UPI00106413B3|nr:sugar ABC transporter permease [Rathayibacter sp. PhB151]TDX81016.1 multiple sugar transport system permease protein [Rathayibacter sp. PhB151]